MAAGSTFDAKVLAEIDLTGCPVGNVLDPNEPDQRGEETYFKGWTNGLTAPGRWGMPSCYRVVRDGDREVLEHINKTDRSLVAGEPLWGEYTVEAHVRQLFGDRADALYFGAHVRRRRAGTLGEHDGERLALGAVEALEVAVHGLRLRAGDLKAAARQVVGLLCRERRGGEQQDDPRAQHEQPVPLEEARDLVHG